ncbi:hypothetical protein [Hydrogenimonas sp. SS33]|uniref:tetratricopeptide repeat protein n=1 Tax=Hydrogenimonas leucolamina TaxID=2954236 RepID=UPI00336BC4F0
MEERRYTVDEAIGLYEEERYEEAMKAFRQHRKDMRARYYIGMMYFEGFGVEQDVEEAKRWFKKASRQGSLDAEYMYLCCEGNTSSCCKG